MAEYAPTSEEVDALAAWLASEHLQVTGVTPDHLLVHVRAPTSTVESAFGTAIDNYTFDGRTFYANDGSPTVPPDLHIHSIGGLSNFQVYEPDCFSGGTDCGFNGADWR